MTALVSVAPEFEAANQQYAESFTGADLASPPSRYVFSNLQLLYVSRDQGLSWTQEGASRDMHGLQIRSR